MHVFMIRPFKRKIFCVCCRLGPNEVAQNSRKKCKVIRKKIMNTLIMQVEWAQPLYSFSSEKTGDHLSAELFAEPFAVHLAQLKLNHYSRLAKMGWQMNCRHNSCARNQNCLSIATWTKNLINAGCNQTDSSGRRRESFQVSNLLFHLHSRKYRALHNLFTWRER